MRQNENVMLINTILFASSTHSFIPRLFRYAQQHLNIQEVQTYLSYRYLKILMCYKNEVSCA